MTAMFRGTLSFALLALAPLAASPAAAAPAAQFTATLKAPLAQPRQQIIDGVMWSCAGDTCQGADEGQQLAGTCGQVVRSFGQVTAFANSSRKLADAALARCNTAH
jgi:hypothetical protein